MSNVKIIRTSNVKLFDVRHSNDECQNDLNVSCLTFNTQMSNVKMIKC